MKTQYNKNREHMLNQVLAAHAEAVVKLQVKVGNKIVLIPFNKLTIIISERLRTRAGLAKLYGRYGSYYKYEIHLNARLLSENPQELIPTYLHELAHIVANILKNGNDGHGVLWKSIMGILGQKAERFHTMDVSSLARLPKRYAYKCVSCDKVYSLTVHRHKKQTLLATMGRRGYHCRCGKDIAHNV